MKKIMSLMIGLSLVVGAASYAFADDAGKGKDKGKTEDKKKKKKKGGDEKPKS